MHTSEQLDKLAAALSKAQGEVTGALKSADNPFFKSKYADLAACWDAARGPLSANGLSVAQTPSTTDDGAVCVTTRLMHSSGQWIEDTMACKPAKNDAQALGSVTTYLRRYGLAAIVGLAQVDDDGEAAVVHDEKTNNNEMTPVKKTAKGKNEFAPVAIPVEPGENGPDWGKWIKRYRAGIEWAKTKDWLTGFEKLNSVPYTNWAAAHDEEAQTAVYNLLDAKYKSFTPFDEE